jgi:hypothetical protein
MKVWKIKHKPTGLFFTPSKGLGNFSTNGKLYSKKPKLEWAYGSSSRVCVKTWSGQKISKKNQILIDYFHIEPDKDSYWVDTYFLTKEEDWEIIEL